MSLATAGGADTQRWRSDLDRILSEAQAELASGIELLQSAFDAKLRALRVLALGHGLEDWPSPGLSEPPPGLSGPPETNIGQHRSKRDDSEQNEVGPSTAPPSDGQRDPIRRRLAPDLQEILDTARAERSGAKKPKTGWFCRTEEKVERDMLVMAMLDEGATLHAAAEAVGVSDERIRQIRRAFENHEPGPTPLPRSQHAARCEKLGIAATPSKRWSDDERKAASEQASERWAKRKGRDAPEKAAEPLLDRARTLFEGGATSDEVAEQLGITLSQALEYWRELGPKILPPPDKEAASAAELAPGETRRIEEAFDTAVLRGRAIKVLEKRGFRMVAPSAALKPGQFMLPLNLGEAPWLLVYCDGFETTT